MEGQVFQTLAYPTNIASQSSCVEWKGRHLCSSAYLRSSSEAVKVFSAPLRARCERELEPRFPDGTSRCLLKSRLHSKGGLLHRQARIPLHLSHSFRASLKVFPASNISPSTACPHGSSEVQLKYSSSINTFQPYSF